MSQPEATDACGEQYRLALSIQRPLACDLEATHGGDEHRARTPTGDVYWRKTR